VCIQITQHFNHLKNDHRIGQRTIYENQKEQDSRNYQRYQEIGRRDPKNGKANKSPLQALREMLGRFHKTFEKENE